MHSWVCTSFFRATWSKFVTNFRPNFKRSQICLTNIDAKVPVHTFACLQPIKAMTKLLEFLGMRTHTTKNGPAMVEPATSYHVICQGGSDIPTSPFYLHSYLGFLTGFCNVPRTDVPTCREQCTSQSEYVNGEFHSSNFSGVRIIYSEPSSLAKCSTLISYHVMLSMTRV